VDSRHVYGDASETECDTMGETGAKIAEANKSVYGENDLNNGDSVDE
jgi:hypothetical protein